MFHDRVLSRLTKNIWPTHYCELNPIDFCLSGVYLTELGKVKPVYLEDLKGIVESLANSLDKDVLQKSARSVNS